MMGPQSPGAPRAAADDAWPPFVFRIAVADDAAADRERLRCALDPSVEWRVL